MATLTKTIERMTATGIAYVSEPFFLIVMNFSLRSRSLEVKRSGSVLETRDRAVPARVTASGGEDNRKKLDAACFSASCGRALSEKRGRACFHPTMHGEKRSVLSLRLKTNGVKGCVLREKGWLFQGVRIPKNIDIFVYDMMQ